MKSFVLATAILAGSLAGVGNAEPVVCNEPWQGPEHPPVHPPPCHPRPGGHAPSATSCGFRAFAQEDVTGGQDTYTGVAYGYVIAAHPGETVSIRCFVSVDGNDVASTPTASGTTAASTEGPVTFTATDTQEVALCADWTDGAESGTECFPTTNTQIPPQPVIDLLEQLTSIPDFLLCPVLASLAPGVPGVVDISPEGDVSIAGEPFWDCPPYDV